MIESDSQVDVIHQKRIASLMQAVCTQSIPYPSEFQQQLQTNGIEHNSEMLEVSIRFLLELRRWNCYIYEKFVLLPPLCKKLWEGKNGELITRCFLYKKLHESGLTDTVIYQQLYDNTPEEERGEKKTFFNKMRVWKTRKFKQIEKILPTQFAVDNDIISKCKQRSASDQNISEQSLCECTTEILNAEIYSPYKIKPYYQVFEQKAGKTKNAAEVKRAYYHFYEQTQYVILRKIEDVNEIYLDCCKTFTNYIKARCILMPTKAAEMLAILSKQRVKAPKRPKKEDHKADIYRALAREKLKLNPKADAIDAAAKTYSRKYKDMQADLDDYMTSPERHLSRLEAADTGRFFREIQRRRKQQPRKKITDWSGILKLLEEYESNFDEIKHQKILEKIFNVCRAKRDWIEPTEIKYKQTYEIWLYDGFFQRLYELRDEKNCVSPLKDLRFHQVELSYSLFSRSTEKGFGKPTSYTPFGPPAGKKAKKPKKSKKTLSRKSSK